MSSDLAKYPFYVVAGVRLANNLPRQRHELRALALLGDAVIRLARVEEIEWRRLPLQYLVHRETNSHLANIALQFGVEGSASLRATRFEALVGYVYRNQGVQIAREFVYDALLQEFRGSTEIRRAAA